MQPTDPFEIASLAVKLYAASSPRPCHVTITDAAEMLHLSRPSVRKLIAAGHLTTNPAQFRL